jgi:hypothetical protein
LVLEASQTTAAAANARASGPSGLKNMLVSGAPEALVVDSTDIKAGIEKLPLVTKVVIKMATSATTEITTPTPSAFINFI